MSYADWQARSVCFIRFSVSWERESKVIRPWLATGLPELIQWALISRIANLSKQSLTKVGKIPAFHRLIARFSN